MSQHQPPAGPDLPADPGQRKRRGTVRLSLAGAVLGLAVLALAGSAALALTGHVITIAAAPAARPAISPAGTPAAAPSPSPIPAVRVVTRWRTRTVTRPGMAALTVLDPTGTGLQDQAWRTQIPCVYNASSGLIPGVAGAGNAVNETCSMTVVQLESGTAVILKDASGHFANFALSPAS